jgi:hypothetical protein
MLTVAPNMFPNFQGLYYYIGSDPKPRFYYYINEKLYNVRNFYKMDLDFNNYYKLMPSFTIDPTGSQIVAVNLSYQTMLYQKLQNGRFVPLLSEPIVYGQLDEGEEPELSVSLLRVPDNNHKEVNLGYFEISPSWIKSFISHFGDTRNFNDVLYQLNHDRHDSFSVVFNPENYLQSTQKDSYEALKEIYKTLPDHLNINGLRVDVLSFQQIADMLTQNQIERYIIDPILQPWAQEPYKILTFFNKNGMTYLAKVKYDQTTNRILP